MARSSTHDIVIIGGGAGGIATAASLLKRRPLLDIAIVEPQSEHYYQPGWTMVGGGVFDAPVTCRPMASVIPERAHWIRRAAASFQPEANRVTLDDGSTIEYKLLVVAPGIRLAWEQIKGLEETLGRNGVTSNYRYDLAPYTWELVRNLKSGRAIFSQPPMPIKCAGAPQKAMYLSCDAWAERGVLDAIDVEFRNAGGVLFGVEAYVPALMDYVARYGIDLKLQQKLVAVDGEAKTATFETIEGGET
ncbi:MAG: FAD/NAD(P)-binding oxidoreductase, partial [Pseudomonadota bacterium]|nr:FAD/NAD(P)-binding oxidoreductase [Pseudomonadota bacterium]